MADAIRIECSRPETGVFDRLVFDGFAVPVAFWNGLSDRGFRDLMERRDGVLSLEERRQLWAAMDRDGEAPGVRLEFSMARVVELWPVDSPPLGSRAAAMTALRAALVRQ